MLPASNFCHVFAPVPLHPAGVQAHDGGMDELVEGILPRGEVSLLAGASGAGKTTLVMQLLRAIQRGEPLFQRRVKPGLRLGYIAADRSWESYQRLAATLDIDLAPLRVKTLIDDETINLDTFEVAPMRVLKQLIGELLPLDLLVVDPLVVFLGVDTNKYHLNAAKLILLNRWCRQHSLTILGTHHASKARTDFSFKRPQDRINGSGALLGFTSTQLFLAAPEETGSEFTEWHIVSHHAPAAQILLVREGAGFREATTGDTAPTGRGSRKGDVIATLILRLVPGDGTAIPRSVLHHKLAGSASPRLIDDRLSELVASEVLLRESGGYRLPI